MMLGTVCLTGTTTCGWQSWWALLTGAGLHSTHTQEGGGGGLSVSGNSEMTCHLQCHSTLLGSALVCGHDQNTYIWISTYILGVPASKGFPELH